MNGRPAAGRKPTAVLLALLFALLFAIAAAPGFAAVTTVHSCPSSGHGGNHDTIFNGFFVTGLNAVNVHTVQLFYTTDQNGTYSLSLTARRGSYAGPLVATLSKSVSLSTSADTAVTWDFADAPINLGDSLYFTHALTNHVQFNLQPTLCPGNTENAGTSAVDNGFSVATTITTNTGVITQSCAPNATTLCLDDQAGDKRFQVRVSFGTSQGGGQSGDAKAISLSSLSVTQGGLFWFFSLSNPEVLVKVLNGCGVNSRFWVFVTAGTNVGFTVTVTDMHTGKMATYTNPDLTVAKPVQDTSSPLTCS